MNNRFISNCTGKYCIFAGKGMSFSGKTKVKCGKSYPQGGLCSPWLDHKDTCLCPPQSLRRSWTSLCPNREKDRRYSGSKELCIYSAVQNITYLSQHLESYNISTKWFEGVCSTDVEVSLIVPLQEANMVVTLCLQRILKETKTKRIRTETYLVLQHIITVMDWIMGFCKWVTSSVLRKDSKSGLRSD